MNETICINNNWRFHAGDISNGSTCWGLTKSGVWNQNGARSQLDDSGWRAVNLPHDYVVEGPFATSDEKFEDSQAIPEMWSIENLLVARGSQPAGVGWYRRRLKIDEADRGKRLYLKFDGVFRDSRVYLNDYLIGHEPSGYSSFVYDITDFVIYGADNILAVRVDASQPEGWWYEGGGIYRDVFLIKTDPLHIALTGLFVHSEVHHIEPVPQAAVYAEVPVENDRSCPCDIELITEVLDEELTVQACMVSVHTLKAHSSLQVKQEAVLDGVRLWSPDLPHLYTARVTVRHDDRTVNISEVSFGVRKIEFTPDRGFFLNGRPLKIKGVCCHQDHGGLGVALTRGVYQYRLRRLKEMGCNAYRTAHHPPSPALLDLCDRMGILVLCETRLLSSAKEEMRQMENLIIRDRNHPSVILWSIGNEEARTQRNEFGPRIVRTMKQRIRQLDPTREVTLAVCFWNHYQLEEDPAEMFIPIGHELDVMGLNYSPSRWQEYHDAQPFRPLLVTEASSSLRTRGCWQTDKNRCQVFGGEEGLHWRDMAEEQWSLVARHDWLSGTFIWTGFDYRGEPTPYSWPAVASQFGLMDVCGFPKDNYYYFKSWWRPEEPLVHVFPHWNLTGREGTPVTVWCFSNCDEVELLVNGISAGRKKMPSNSHLEWEGIIYEPGRLEAVGFNDGKRSAACRMETAGEAVAVQVEPDSRIHEGETTLWFMTARAVDSAGRFVPDACHEIGFYIDGPAEVLGTANGDPMNHAAHNSCVLKLFNGLAQIIVRAPEGVAVKVSADMIEAKPMEETHN